MKMPRSTNASAFSLIELLVVIAIIVVVAGLVVGLSAAASDRKNISRTQVERDRLVTLIENYKSRLGIYPPDNASNPGRNSLLYELAGATVDRSVANPLYQTRFGDILSSDIFSGFGTNGIINASEVNASTDPTERRPVHQVLKDLKPDQRAPVVSNTLSLVIPIDGPSGKPNPWQYLVGENARHNKDSFDLWVEIKVRGQMRTIGNWKE
jgi:prepilin-type N-terminal cleavage/methylation domain-containing protein